MVSLSNVSKSYDFVKVLNKVSFSLSKGEIVGLVGKNGSGKSTILKILNSQISVDSGAVDVWGVLCYLPQHFDFKEKTINEFLKNSLSSEYTEYKIPILMQDLEIDYLDLSQDPNTLSGGEKTRIYLASLFINQIEPEILLLDEPTNNLDLKGLSILENFIKKFKGVVLLVSHDRYFLDKVCNKTIEIENGDINIYGGNYTFYKNQKDIESDATMRKYVSQQKDISNALFDINDYTNKALWGEKTFTSGSPYERKKAAKAAKQATVRKKKLKKFIESAYYIPKPKQVGSYYLPLKNNIPKSQLAIKASNLNVTVANNLLISDINFSVYGGEHIWVSGKNGSGKSSLLKMLESKNREVVLGTNVVAGSVKQDFNLNINSLGLTYLKEFGIGEFDIFKLADSLRLMPNDLKVPLKTLSSGQQLKIEFIKLILGGFNLLLLDEPTNHLEVETREDIERVLSNYEGCLIVVSHDRYFLDNIGIDRTLEIKDKKLLEI